MTFETTHATDTNTKCTACGAIIKFAPGTTLLKCEFCANENEINVVTTVVEENDFNAFLDNQYKTEDLKEVATVKCGSCGANTTLKPNVTSDNCPFCSTSLVLTQTSVNKLVKPKYILPFKVNQKEAFQKFKAWVTKLWFAPGDLKKYADDAEKLTGVYIPYWTYDSATASQYAGERGDNYYVTQTYPTVVNGRTVMRTRTVTKIRWSSASGHVQNKFDDVLVPASHNLPAQYIRHLEPWDLENLTGFNESFLSGFKTESYQSDVKESFEAAKAIMAETITATIKKDIGGDHQRIHNVATNYSGITFKHILLPLWISAFKYKAKVFRFLVNARTGEVTGERPYSYAKIALAVLGALGLIAAIAAFAGQN